MIDHLLNSISQTELKKDPFDYKFVKNIFPDEFYHDLINNLPEKTEYTPINESGTVNKNYSSERFMFDLNYENIKKLSIKKQEILSNLLNVFRSRKFFDVIANNFKDVISKRISEFNDYEKQLIGTDNFKFTIQAMLVKDLQKYKLGAHTDTTLKFLTFLFYIPRDLSQINLGTTLYKPKDDVSIKMGEKGNYHANLKMTKELFSIVEKIPFSPNSLLLFPRTNYSFHGVEEINTENIERDLIQLNYYFKTNNNN